MTLGSRRKNYVSIFLKGVSTQTGKVVTNTDSAGSKKGKYINRGKKKRPSCLKKTGEGEAKEGKHVTGWSQKKEKRKLFSGEWELFIDGKRQSKTEFIYLVRAINYFRWTWGGK